MRSVNQNPDDAARKSQESLPQSPEELVLSIVAKLRPPGFDPRNIYSAKEVVVDLKLCSRNMLIWWIKHGLPFGQKGSKKQFFRGKDLEEFMFGDKEVPPLPRRKKNPKAR